MKTDKDKTIMVFRMMGGEVLALMPNNPTRPGTNWITCYAHIGQHGEADYGHCIAHSRPATAKEAAPLIAELKEHFGYNTEVRKHSTYKTMRSK